MTCWRVCLRTGCFLAESEREVSQRVFCSIVCCRLVGLVALILRLFCSASCNQYILKAFPKKEICIKNNQKSACVSIWLCNYVASCLEMQRNQRESGSAGSCLLPLFYSLRLRRFPLLGLPVCCRLSFNLGA